MKSENILKFGLVLLLYSCGHPNKEQSLQNSITDSLQINVKNKAKETFKEKDHFEETGDLDSLRLDQVLEKSIEIGYQNIQAKHFNKKFSSIPDSAFEIETELESGNIFSQTYKHLIVHRKGLNNVYIDIYVLFGNKFNKILCLKESLMTYVSDTIRDVNGDGFKDFILNWYGSSGCCLKAFSDVYLSQSSEGAFTGKFEFINPTFSQNEKAIRGVCYGQPGETEMYKYKWNGVTVDTIEYIYFEKNKKGEKTGIIIRSNRQRFDYKNKIYKKLNSIPKEYKKINGYDWFTGEGYE